MHKKEYVNKRNALLDEINGLIETGKIEDANAKMKEVEKLDADFENAAVAAAIVMYEIMVKRKEQ